MTEDMQTNKQLERLATQYADCDRRSAEINEERQQIRENAEKLGIPSKSFQHAVGMVKGMTEGERTDYTNGVNRMLEAIGTEEMRATLFPEIVEAERRRAAKEAERAAAKQAAEGRTPEELNAETDSNPRSDPEAGGAAKATKKGKKQAVTGERPTEEELTAAAAKAAQAQDPEQAEGDAALKAMMPETRSQSQIAAEKLEQAGLNR